MQRPNIDDVAKFLLQYASNMLSVGTYTARVDRCVGRIAKAYGYDVSLSAFTKHFSISIVDISDSSNFRTYVKTMPNSFISFRLISDLSALSWQIYDEKFELEKAKAYFDIIMRFTHNEAKKTLLFISIANAAFCRLFGGDMGGMASVFVATFVGFFIRITLTKFNINLKLQYILVSFVSSFIAYLGILFGFSLTPDITIGSSVLYLIPGVRLINSIFDILNENVLVGISRGISTGLLIFCIAIGVYITISISNIGILNV